MDISMDEAVQTVHKPTRASCLQCHAKAGGGDAAVFAGLENMGFSADDDYQWVTTDTYQLLNHQVSPSDDALSCTACHMNIARMDLQGELGFAPTKTSRSTCSSGCHSAEKAYEWEYGSLEEFRAHHKKHREKGYDCRDCHGFDR